jgi:hypothetical protein
VSIMAKIRLTYDHLLQARLYEALMEIVNSDIEGGTTSERRRLHGVLAAIVQEADESLYRRAVESAEAQADAEAEQADG